MKEQPDGKVLLEPEEVKEYLIYTKSNWSEVMKRSHESLKCVKDDVDEPMRNIVAMLNLLGVKTTWSCCGFDYEGQPIHKDHTYGYTYVMMHADERALCVLKKYSSFQHALAACWATTLSRSDDVAVFTLGTRINRSDFWTKSTSPHYHELGATLIKCMEDFLITLKDEFRDTAVLVDTNATYRERFPLWQYPAKNSWTIKKSDIRLVTE